MIPDPEYALMKKIHEALGDYIAGAVEGTPFPPALLAAITANESSGNAAAQRLESSVFVEFTQMVVGQKLSFAPAGVKAPITLQQITRFFIPPSFALTGKLSVPSDVLSLLHLSTSFGPMQIMGWHAAEFAYDIADLTNIATHFERAVQLLEQFEARYKVIPIAGWCTNAADGFMRCWNTGSPIGKTFNSDYVPLGLKRFSVYEQILAEAKGANGNTTQAAAASAAH